MQLTVDVVAQFDFFNDKTIVRLQKIDAGLCNQNYCVGYIGGQVLFRVFGEAVDEGVRQQEFKLQSHANTLGIAPKPLIHYLPEHCPTMFTSWCDKSSRINHGVMITQFFDGMNLSNHTAINPSYLTRLAHQLAQLHDSSCDTECETNQVGQSLLYQYWNSFNDKNPKTAAIYQALNRQMNKLSFDHNALIHGDLNAGNLLVSDTQQCIVDWEFSGKGDWYFDLATVTIELKLTPQESHLLLTQYATQRGNVTVSIDKLNLMQLYYLGICWLWQPPLAQQAGQLSEYQLMYRDKLIKKLNLLGPPN